MKKENTTTWPALASAAVLAGLLAGCASPQQIAVGNYCTRQGYDQYPADIVTVIERQSVRVGEKVTGSRRTCNTVLSKDKASRTETCTNEDITEGVYEWQDVPVNIDKNGTPRKAMVQNCVTDSMRQGLYAELNDD